MQRREFIELLGATALSFTATGLRPDEGRLAAGGGFDAFQAGR